MPTRARTTNPYPSAVPSRTTAVLPNVVLSYPTCRCRTHRDHDHIAGPAMDSDSNDQPAHRNRPKPHLARGDRMPKCSRRKDRATGTSRQ